MSGFAHIHRSLLGHPAFRNDAEAMTFAWMVIRASWKPSRVRYKGKAISLQRGQLAVSVRDLAEAMDRDKAWIERLFKRLKSETMIETHTETGVSIVTICNYAQYQAKSEIYETVNETPPETDARQTRDTEQEDKELKERIISEDKSSSIESAREKNPFPRPEWADPQVWNDFLTNRKAKKLKNTATAFKGFLDDIRRISSENWPPGKLLEHAVAKGWGGIYEPNGRETRNGIRSENSSGLGRTALAALDVFSRPNPSEPRSIQDRANLMPGALRRVGDEP